MGGSVQAHAEIDGVFSVSLTLCLNGNDIDDNENTEVESTSERATAIPEAIACQSAVRSRRRQIDFESRAPGYFPTTKIVNESGSQRPPLPPP